MQAPDIALPTIPLRDYFAAEAMTAIINRVGTGADLDAVARTAYAMADQMLIAREHEVSSWPRLHTDFAKG